MFCVDRFEGIFAVLVDDYGDVLNIETDKLPLCVKEGDIVKIVDGIYIIDYDEKRKRAQNIKKIQSGLWE